MTDTIASNASSRVEAMVARARRLALATIVRRAARRHGGNTAIVCGDVRWSYREFDAVIDALAAGLRATGISAGDRVAVLARNSHAFIALRFAIARADAVLVPVNFMLNAADVGYILEHSGARLLFADATTIAVGAAAAGAGVERIYGLAGEFHPAPAGYDSWESLIVETAPMTETRGGADLLQIIYTSGTESRPKGAMLSHDAVLWEYQSCIVDCEWTADTVAVHAMPLFHCAQLDCMIGPALQVGATNVITSEPTAANIIGLLAAHAATSFFAPPTVWISLLRSPLLKQSDLSRLTKGYYGASIMPVEVLRELQDRLPRLRLWNLYGQTEIAPVATILFPDEHRDRLGSAGRPTLNVETRIVHDDMTDVAVGEVGEIVHRSPQLLTGYWQDSERTAEAFAGGWFHSGDLGRFDDAGYITVVDRKKDMIKSGGENISSREVEEVLYRHPAVSEAAVVGLPDAKWIEAVTAVVVLRDGHAASGDELAAHCADHLSSFKVPKAVIFRTTLPRNASGKILKRDLRDALQPPT